MGLFDGFNPNMGWLSAVLSQQQQNQLPADLMNPQIYGNAGQNASGGPSPLNPMSWRFPSLDNVLTGMLNGPDGAPTQSAPQQQPGGPPPLDAPINVGPQRFGQGPSAPMAQPQQPPALPPQAANAMAQAPQAMPQQAQQSPDFLQGLSNFSHNLGSTPGLPGIIDAFRGIQTGQRYDAAGQRQQNQQTQAQAIYTSLQARGYPPQVALGMAQAAASDPKVAEKILGEAYAIPKTAEELAVRQATMGGQPGQASGSPFDILRQKNAAEKAGTTEGERVANAQLDLPTAVAQANETLRLTDQLKNHKGRDNPFFWHSKGSAYLPDSAIPGNTDARDAMGILGSIKGSAFLEAFKTLKGGGQITEVEGKKATDALNRMDRSQSRAEFDRALSDFQGIVKLGVDRANQIAGKPAPGGFQGNSSWQQVSPGVRIRQVQ